MSLFNKKSGGSMFNKFKEAGQSMFNKFKQDPQGFINKAVDVASRGVSALEKVVPSATATMMSALPEFAPQLAVGSAALSKGLHKVSGLLEKHGNKAGAIAGVVAPKQILAPQDPGNPVEPLGIPAPN